MIKETAPDGKADKPRFAQLEPVVSVKPMMFEAEWRARLPINGDPQRV